ncbi:uncharacterized protein LOC111354998 [Spodoptera litura]|uniref:Uncharacterized protein LOC111354998 n=1 Tax=Spodoptera litura TaxID=69820 RepID=A0A9J7E4Y1_SPOLT|nr:uncharacterized protein LOC111354998 [Spodoptera litura]
MSTQTPIINDVLALLQNVYDFLDEGHLLDLCKSAFKKPEINRARWLLFETLDKVDQIPSRQRDSTDNIIQDIVTVFKETDPDEVPNFVVKNIFKVLCFEFNHFDVTKILNDIKTMKTSLAELQSKLVESNNTVCDLRAEVVQLRSAASASKLPDTSNVNAGCKVPPAATGSESVVATVSPVEPVSVASHAAANSTSALVQEPASVGALTANRVYADVATTSQSVPPQKKKVVQTKLDQTNQMSLKKDTCDDDGFIKVEKKNKKKKPHCRNQRGTAPKEPDMVLRPATPTTQLYLSRLHHSMTVEDVVKYIRELTGWTLRVERLESRYKMNYKSFVVRVPSDHLDTFLKEEFWPTGVVYRRFRGRLRNTSQRDTTPVLRVH